MSNRLDKPLDSVEIEMWAGSSDEGFLKVTFDSGLTYREFRNLKVGDTIAGKVTQIRREVIERG